MKKGWEIKRLPEIAEYFIGLTYSPKDVGSEGTIVLRSSNVQNDELDLSDLVRVTCSVKKPLHVRKGDILMCSRNGSKRLVGKTAVIGNLPEEMTFGTFMTVIRSERNPYLSWFFRSEAFRDQIGVGENTMINQITKYMLDVIRVPIPPLAEQQRIVGLLDEAFEGLATAKANAEKNLQNARALFESALTTAMSGKLTKGWRKSHPHVETGRALLEQILAKRRRAWSKKGEYPEPVPPVTNDSQSIPASWTWSNLSQLKTFSLYGPRFSNDDYSQTGVLVLRTTDIDEHGKVNSDTAPKLKMTEEEFDKYQCKKGDLLITRTGSLGTLAVFDDDTRAIPGAYLIQFRLCFSEVIPWFLFAFFKSPAAQVRLTSGGTGAGIQNLNVPTLEAIPIPFPPLDEQREIVSQLNTLAEETQRLARLYERKLAALEALKKSLLHQAFTGAL